MIDNEIWPNLFVVGAAKAGTTTLYEYLNATEGIYMSPVKGPRFFHYLKSPHRVITEAISDEKDYLKLFSNVKDVKIIGEVSPTYLRDPESPKLIHEKVPNAKILIILRDPVQRAFSHYLMRKNRGQEIRTFHQIIEDYIRDYKTDGSNFDLTVYAGLYTKNIKKYTDIFGSKNVKILIFEEFIKDTANQFKEVLNFLQVDSELPPNINVVYNSYAEPRNKISKIILSNKLVNKIGKKLISRNTRRDLKNTILSREMKKPKLPEKEGVLLQKFYQEDVDNLEKFLGRKLPWKWFN